MPKEDTFGKCDPFVQISVGSLPVKKTKVIKNTYNPKWEEEFHFDLPNPGTPIFLKFIDYDEVGANDPFGSVQINSNSLVIGQIVEN